MLQVFFVSVYTKVYTREIKKLMDDTERYNIRKNVGILKYVNYTYASKSSSFMHKNTYAFLCMSVQFTHGQLFIYYFLFKQNVHCSITGF